MSRTRKTTPGAVRMRQYHLYVPVHDHRFGPCDLDPDAPPAFWPPDRRCFLGPSSAFWFGPDAGCPCPICHGGYYGNFPARSARHAAKRIDHLLSRGVDPDDLGL